MGKVKKETIFLENFFEDMSAGVLSESVLHLVSFSSTIQLNI